MMPIMALDHRLGVLNRALVVHDEAAALGDPGEAALDHPSAGQHLEAPLYLFLADDVDDHAESFFGPGDEAAGVPAVGPDETDTGVGGMHLLAHRASPVSVLDAGRGDHDREQQACGVDDDVALAAIGLLAGVISLVSAPTVSVPFTDWASMIAAVGSESLPSASRTATRRASWAASMTPSLVQARK